MAVVVLTSCDLCAAQAVVALTSCDPCAVCRRRQVSQLDASLSGGELLLIDELVTELGVEKVEGWTGGTYPPPSLQALLNMYLLPDPPLHLKHRIVQYLFLDLSSILTDG